MSLQELAEEIEGFSLAQIEALWKLYVPRANDPKNQINEQEFKIFLERCISSGLDPFSKQIGIVKRGGKASVDVNIDGLRAIAEWSGMYAGTTTSYWCGEDGEWKEIWLKKWGFPVAAKVGVFKRGCDAPFWGVALWDEFAQTYKGNPSDMWAKMPAHMLAKCSEAIALKKAFPMGGRKAEEAQFDSSNDNLLVAGYRRLALPPSVNNLVFQENWEHRFQNLSQITSCPMPTIHALCQRWIGVSLSKLNEESARKLRGMVMIQWATTIGELGEKDAIALYANSFWSPERRLQSDEELFADWKAFVQKEATTAIDVVPATSTSSSAQPV